MAEVTAADRALVESRLRWVALERFGKTEHWVDASVDDVAALLATVRAEGEEFRRKYHEAMDILAAWKNIDHADAVAQVLILKARVTALEAALRELLALVEDGRLVRNTTNDAHMPSYLSESVRLVKALATAKEALAPGAGGTA